MRFPNAYRGIKKIFAGGIMAAVVVVLTAVLTLTVKVSGVGGEAVSADLTRKQAILAAIVGIGYLLGIVILSLAGLIAVFWGVVQARKDDSHFSTAFFTALLSLVIGFVVSFFLKNVPQIQRWASLGGSVCGMLTQFFVLGGIAGLAEKMGDGKVKVMAEKARVIFCAVSVASAAAGLIAAYLPDAVFPEIVGYGLSIGAFVYSLTVLAKGKKMLAG